MNFWIIFAVVVVISLIVLTAFAVPVFKQLKQTTRAAEGLKDNIRLE